jgi:hypothetical protein
VDQGGVNRDEKHEEAEPQQRIMEWLPEISVHKWIQQHRASSWTVLDYWFRLGVVEIVRETEQV